MASLLQGFEEVQLVKPVGKTGPIGTFVVL